VYADSAENAENLAKDFYLFVDEKRKQGIAITAEKLAEALKRYKDNFLLISYLKSK
jgi:hypothetical protein